jgi:hypothetical protein
MTCKPNPPSPCPRTSAPLSTHAHRPPATLLVASVQPPRYSPALTLCGGAGGRRRQGNQSSALYLDKHSQDVVAAENNLTGKAPTVPRAALARVNA